VNRLFLEHVLCRCAAQIAFGIFPNCENRHKKLKSKNEKDIEKWSGKKDNEIDREKEINRYLWK